MSKEIYLKREEVSNVEATINSMLDVLVNETKKQGKEGHCQVVLFLLPDEKGDEWKMFVYFDADSNDFRYSFQDQNYEDTDFFFHNSREEVMTVMLEEINDVCGFDGICVDY